MDSRRGHSRDRISNLPDAVLCHIISFIPLKFAVGTSILSRRWRYLWTSIPYLEFNDNLLLHQGNYPETSQHFVNFVNSVLLLSDVSIKTFRLKCHRYCNPDIVRSWICAAIKRKVQVLWVNMKKVKDLDLPRILFTCRTLVFLKLSSVPELPASVWLPNLEVLNIKSFTFTKADSLQKLFDGCPDLEELVIEKGNWDTPWDFNVSSVALKVLSIHLMDKTSTSESEDFECKLKVDAPNLEYLSLSDFGSVDYSLNNPSSLFKAYIDVGQVGGGFLGFGYAPHVYKLLWEISNLKSLTLSEETMAHLVDDNDCTLPTFHNLTHLELSANGANYWSFLTDFLINSPNLEVLVLEKSEIYTLEMDEHWSPPQHVPYCLESHLREIEIIEFNGALYEFEAIEYFLENAKVLKKITIDCRDLRSEKESSSTRERLSRFPVSDGNCEISLLF